MGVGPGIQDPGSGKNLFRIPDPGVKKAPDPGSGSAALHLIRINQPIGILKNGHDSEISPNEIVFSMA
jgi:hypothetical protein